ATGFMPMTRAWRSARVCSKAAVTRVLPTPVSVPVTNKAVMLLMRFSSQALRSRVAAKRGRRVFQADVQRTKRASHQVPNIVVAEHIGRHRIEGVADGAQQ